MVGPSEEEKERFKQREDQYEELVVSYGYSSRNESSFFSSFLSLATLSGEIVCAMKRRRTYILPILLVPTTSNSVQRQYNLVMGKSEEKEDKEKNEEEEEVEEKEKEEEADDEPVSDSY